VSEVVPEPGFLSVDQILDPTSPFPDCPPTTETTAKTALESDELLEPISALLDDISEDETAYPEAIVVPDEGLETRPALPDEGAFVPTAVAEATPMNVSEQEPQKVSADREVHAGPEDVPHAKTQTSPAAWRRAQERQKARPELGGTVAQVPERIAKPVRLPWEHTAAERPRPARRVAVVASILLLLAVLAAWLVQAQLPRTPVEPAAAIAADTPAVVAAGSVDQAAISEGSDFE
jgi:hypothetical protein